MKIQRFVLGRIRLPLLGILKNRSQIDKNHHAQYYQ